MNGAPTRPSDSPSHHPENKPLEILAKQPKTAIREGMNIMLTMINPINLATSHISKLSDLAEELVFTWKYFLQEEPTHWLKQTPNISQSLMQKGSCMQHLVPRSESVNCAGIQITYVGGNDE